MYDDELDASFKARLQQVFTSELNLVGLNEALGGFVDQVAEDLVPDELPDVQAEDLAAVLARIWRFARSGDLTATRVQLSGARGFGGRDLELDALAIAQADVPFLVDSVMGALAADGFAVKAMFHPVLELDSGGGRQSMILVLLAPVGEDRRTALLEEIGRTLHDVHAAVADVSELRALAERTADELAGSRASFEPYGAQEYVGFLRWLTADRFVFLGARTYDYPRTPDGGYAAEEPVFTPEGSLGLLRDQSLAVLRRASEPAILTSQLGRYLEDSPPVVIAKSTLRSRVRRPRLRGRGSPLRRPVHRGGL